MGQIHGTISLVVPILSTKRLLIRDNYRDSRRGACPDVSARSRSAWRQSGPENRIGRGKRPRWIQRYRVALDMP
jgi:hypothetical protein